jgi:hypothetical protein
MSINQYVKLRGIDIIKQILATMAFLWMLALALTVFVVGTGALYAVWAYVIPDIWEKF